MRLGPRRRRAEQLLQSILGIHVSKIGAMRAQLSEQWQFARVRSLSHDGNAKSWNRRRLRWRHGMQTVSVVRRRVAEGVELMGCPEVGRKLFDKLSRQVDPIKMFQFLRKANLFEAAEPLLELFRRQGVHIRNFLFERFPVTYFQVGQIAEHCYFTADLRRLAQDLRD